MLPWLIGIGVAAAGKFIYDALSDDDYESSSSTQARQEQEKKEYEYKQIKYEKIVEEYQTKLKNRYEAECIANPKDTFSGVFPLSIVAFPPLKFKKSKKLDDIQKDIKNLKKDIDALWEINMYAKSLIKEENETSVK